MLACLLTRLTTNRQLSMRDKGEFTSSHSHSWTLTNWWMESQAPSLSPIEHPQVLHQSCSIMASKCISILTRSWVRVRMIMDFNWISKLARSRRPSASPSSTWSPPQSAYPHALGQGLQVHLWVQLDFGLQLHIQTSLIKASKLARWWPLGASPNSLD